ncbi:MAG: FIST C-terminal domain-containing protein [Candidatus Omnitrophica bacterium]|nr:FIST C-terminal domain-containing protein [Candidatus Omnitrophota bacterium]
MATHIAIGFSSADDPVTAFKEAAVMAKTQTGLPKNDLVMVAATPSHAAAATAQGSANALDTVLRTLNPEQLIGMIAPGLIWSEGAESKGVVILSLSSNEISVGTTVQHSISAQSLSETGLRFTRDLGAQMHTSQRQGAILFCDTLILNHNQLIQGLQEGLGPAFPIAGAITPGGIFCQNQLHTDAIGGLLIGGNGSFVTSMRHGWQPLGKPRVIDDSAVNTIRTIDGKPAVSIYQEYFPERFSQSQFELLGNIGSLYPLGINTSRPKEYIIKCPTSVLHDGSLVCQGNVPRGSRVHLMIGDKDACRQAAYAAAVDIRDQLHGKHPKLVIIFASIARRKLYGRSAWQEINQIKEVLGLACPVFGMYTYAEIGATSDLELQPHNASVLIAAIG